MFIDKHMFFIIIPVICLEKDRKSVTECIRTDWCKTTHIFVEQKEATGQSSAAFFIDNKCAPIHGIQHSETPKAYKICLLSSFG